jgi:hypothetical protein
MQIPGDKVTESIRKPEILVEKTSGLDITLLKHQIIRISALSDDRLKQFWCRRSLD